jgi:hypothetical protein
MLEGLRGFSISPTLFGIYSSPLRQRSQQLVTLLSLTVTHPLGNKGVLLTGKINFPGPRVEVV